MMAFHCKMCMSGGPNDRNFEPIRYHMWVRHLTGQEHQTKLQERVSLGSLKRAYALEEDKYVIIGLPRNVDKHFMYPLGVWVSEFGVLTEFYYLQRLGACIVTVQACGVGRHGKGIERAQSLCNEVHFMTYDIKVYRKETLTPVDWNDILHGNCRRLLSEKAHLDHGNATMNSLQKQQQGDSRSQNQENVPSLLQVQSYPAKENFRKPGKAVNSRPGGKENLSTEFLPGVVERAQAQGSQEPGGDAGERPHYKSRRKFRESKRVEDSKVKYISASGTPAPAAVKVDETVSGENGVQQQDYSQSGDVAPRMRKKGTRTMVVLPIINQHKGNPTNGEDNHNEVTAPALTEEAKADESNETMKDSVASDGVSDATISLGSNVTTETYTTDEDSGGDGTAVIQETLNEEKIIAVSEPLNALGPKEEKCKVIKMDEEAMSKESPQQSLVTVLTDSNDSTDTEVEGFQVSKPLDALKPKDAECNVTKMDEEAMSEELPQSSVTTFRDSTDLVGSIAKEMSEPLDGLEPKEEFNATKTDEEAMFGGSLQSSVTASRDSTDSADSVITVTYPPPQCHQYMEPEETNIILRGIEDPVEELKSTIDDTDSVREEDEEPDYMKYVLYWYNKF